MSRICTPFCIITKVTGYNSTLRTLQDLLDAGNSSTLYAAINGSTSDGDLKNILMDASPYLSDAVMIAYLQRTSTPPPGHVREVIIANSPVTPEVMAVIDLMNLPNGIKNQIDAAQTGISARQLLYDEIGQIQFEREMALNEKIRYFLNDTMVVNGMDSVIKIIREENWGDKKCNLAAAYTAKRDYVNAELMLDSVRLENGGQLDPFCQLISILIQLQQAQQGCMLLHTDTAMANDVRAIAEDTLGTPTQIADRSCKNAQALLEAAFNLLFQEVVVYPEDNSNLRTMEELTTQTQTSSSDFSVFPNPASNEITFAYSLDDVDKAWINIYDMTGKKVDSYQIDKSKTSMTISTVKLNSGIYFYSVILANGELIHKDKFSIMK